MSDREALIPLQPRYSSWLSPFPPHGRNRRLAVTPVHDPPPRFRDDGVILDGLFAEDDNGSIRFHPASDLGSKDIQRLQQTLRRRTLKLFRRRGLLDGRPSTTCSPGRRRVASASTPRSASPAAITPAASDSCATAPDLPSRWSDSADPQPPTPAQSAARSRWACLLARVYEVFPPQLPRLRRRDADPRLPHRSLHHGRYPPPSRTSRLPTTAHPRPLPARRAGLRRRSSPRPRPDACLRSHRAGSNPGL